MSRNETAVKTQKGWVDELIEENRAKEKARQEKQEAERSKVPEKKTPNNGKVETVEPKTLSLKDQLAQMIKDKKSAMAVRETLNEAKELQADPENVRLFCDLAGQFEDMEMYNLLLVMDEEGARKELEGLSWKERVDLLGDCSEDDDSVKGLLSGLKKFDGNVPLRGLLFKVYERFYKPLRGVGTMEGLEEFLDGTTEEGLTECVNNATYNLDQFVVVVIEGRKTFYRPKTGISVSKSGWMFVQEAEACAKKDREGMDKIMSQAMSGLTPYKVSKGTDGKLFVPMGPRRGVLVEAFEMGGYTHVKFVDQVGLDAREIPDNEPQMWDEQYSHIATPPNGALSDAWFAVSTAIRHLNQLHIKEVQARHEEREKRFLPLTDIATFETRFEGQGLTRIFNGEEGTVAICFDHFRFGRPTEKVGYFGIAVEGKKGKFYLREVVFDPKFDFKVEELVGEELPLEVNLQTLRVDLKLQPNMERRRFESLQMVKIACFLRLGAEARYSSGEEKPENGNGAEAQNGDKA